MRGVLAISVVLAAGAAAFTPGPALAQGLVPCATEGQFCRVPYPTRVIFGARGQNVERQVGGRGIPCTREAFGDDPVFGVVKRCSYVASGGGGGGRRDEYGPRPGYEPPGGYGRPPRGGYDDDDE